MATLNYNELTNAAEVEVPIKDPMYHWDTHFPERVCRARHDDSPVGRRKGRRRRDRNNARYKTQPITFDEIKEMDEDTNNTEDKDSLKSTLAAFSRSMEGLGRATARRSSSGAASQSEQTRSSDESTSEECSTPSKLKFHQRRRRDDSIEEIPETVEKGGQQ